MNCSRETFGFREQPHGWEYRTPPSWLCSPEHTRGVLVLGYLAGTLSDSDLKGCLGNRENIYEHLSIERPIVEKYFEIVENGETLEQIKMLERWGFDDFDIVTAEHALIITEAGLEFLRAGLANVRTSSPLEIKIGGTVLHGSSVRFPPSFEGRLSSRIGGGWPLTVHIDFDHPDDPSIRITPRAALQLRGTTGAARDTRSMLVTAFRSLLATRNV